MDQPDPFEGNIAARLDYVQQQLNVRHHTPGGPLQTSLTTDDVQALVDAVDALRAENERLRAALVEISELDLEGDASLADALHIADEALNP